MKTLSEKEKRENANRAARILESVYPNVKCALEYDGEPWKLLVMGRLSAQCTDARVNTVSKELFARFPTARELADADTDEIARIIRPCGLYNAKAASIKASCEMLVYECGGVLPNTIDELLKFPGVGRKIANLLLGDIYGIPGIVADTHCMRICARLGMYPETLKDPTRVERIMSSFVSPELQTDFCHRLVEFGRDVCSARGPRCDSCVLAQLCEHCKNS